MIDLIIVQISVMFFQVDLVHLNMYPRHVLHSDLKLYFIVSLPPALVLVQDGDFSLLLEQFEFIRSQVVEVFVDFVSLGQFDFGIYLVEFGGVEELFKLYKYFVCVGFHEQSFDRPPNNFILANCI